MKGSRSKSWRVARHELSKRKLLLTLAAIGEQLPKIVARIEAMPAAEAAEILDRALFRYPFAGAINGELSDPPSKLLHDAMYSHRLRDVAKGLFPKPDGAVYDCPIMGCRDPRLFTFDELREHFGPCKEKFGKGIAYGNPFDQEEDDDDLDPFMIVLGERFDVEYSELGWKRAQRGRARDCASVAS